MKFFNVTSLEKSLEILEENFDFRLRAEIVDTEESLDRVLSQDIFSTLNLPSYNRSTVDGYAINVEDSFGASESMGTLLKMVGSIDIGKNCERKILRGEAMYVPTGGMIPPGCSGVVMIEDTDILGEEILVNRGISQNSNLILEGSEIKKGELVLKKGTKLSYSHIGILSALGVSEVEVYDRIKFYLISTGDEIVDIKETLKLGQVFDINTYALKAMIEKNMGIVVKKVLVKDNLSLLEKQIREGIHSSDIVIVSGGSSVGVMDYTEKAILENNGKILVHGISIKPGKPTIIAKAKEKIILGLPGHPQSAITVFRIMLDKILRKENRFIIGEVGENIFGDPGKSVVINVTIEIETIEEKQCIKVYPVYSKSSMVKPLIQSDGYIVIPPHREGVYKNESIKVWLNE